MWNSLRNTKKFHDKCIASHPSRRYMIRNALMFHQFADVWNVKRQKSVGENIAKLRETVSIPFLFFAFCDRFCAFRDKCVAQLLTFCQFTDQCAKRCEMRNTKRVLWKTLQNQMKLSLYTSFFTFFEHFCAFCGKCIAGFKSNTIVLAPLLHFDSHKTRWNCLYTLFLFHILW